MSLLDRADRYALEIAYLPAGLFGLWQFGLADLRFWALVLCVAWLTYWVSRNVTRRLLRSSGRGD